RLLGLYLRPLRVPTVNLGSATDVASILEPRGLSARFDGWGSLRHLSHDVLLDTLDDDVTRLETLAGSWQPDGVVSTSFGTNGRVFARRRHIPHVDVSIYPMLTHLARPTSFGRAFRHRCGLLAGLAGDDLESAEATRIAWGVGRGTVMLHDPDLLAY